MNKINYRKSLEMNPINRKLSYIGRIFYSFIYSFVKASFKASFLPSILPSRLPSFLPSCAASVTGSFQGHLQGQMFGTWKSEAFAKLKTTTICCGFADGWFHNIWWSKSKICLCSRFQNKERGRHRYSQFCWLQMGVPEIKCSSNLSLQFCRNKFAYCKFLLLDAEIFSKITFLNHRMWFSCIHPHNWSWQFVRIIIRIIIRIAVTNRWKTSFFKAL